jgi:serine/threonine protein kinase/tetratricopeptide (TPR) repeat protein
VCDLPSGHSPGQATPEGAGGEPAHPERVGPYRVIQLLAQGGMGLVYVAEQSEPVRRRVALKVIKAGMDTREVVARFAAERQALAVMDHPNIAKVLDGGVTDDGRPYFVMELVKGVPITEYCDTNRLSTRERLTLFIDVCNAVQHAHQKSVIHRDLKPSNVLVMLQDGKPVPKVIDFGIAKALSQQLTERTLVTQIGQTVGTPAYMSPEQADASALDVDTRTDIYSLGVMLYELLVGRLPLDPAEMGLPAFMMRLAAHEPHPTTPSGRLATLGNAAGSAASHRRTDVKALRRELKGDLDWIVMKALDADRSRRYDTASGLAADIERYLHSEPVAARPPSTVYRMSRFTRRHRTAVVASALVVLALMLGLSAAAVGLVRARRAEALARREAETAHQVSSFLTGLFKVSDPGEARGNSVTAREILDRGADQIHTGLVGQPLVQAQMLGTIGTVYRELGLYAQAQPLLEEALATRRRLLAPDDSLVQASTLELARLTQQQGRFAVAESLYHQTLLSREHFRGPDDAGLVPVLAGIGGMYVTRGRYAEAGSLLTRAVALRSATGAPDDAEFVVLLRNLASADLADGHYAEAEPVFRRALAMAERVLGADSPEVGRTLSNLGIVYYELKRYDDAEQYYLRAEANLTKTLGPDHRNIASLDINIGEVAWRRGQYADARTRLDRALVILRKNVSPGDPSIGTAEYDLGNVLRDQGQLKEAEPHYQRALQIREAAFGVNAPDVAEVLENYAKLLRETGRARQADQMDARARAIREKGK